MSAFPCITSGNIGKLGNSLKVIYTTGSQKIKGSIEIVLSYVAEDIL